MSDLCRPERLASGCPQPGRLCRLPPALLLLGPSLSLRRKDAQQHSTKRAERYCASHEQAQQHVVHSPWDGNYEHRQGYKGHLHRSMHRQFATAGSHITFRCKHSISVRQSSCKIVHGSCSTSGLNDRVSRPDSLLLNRLG